MPELSTAPNDASLTGSEALLTLEFQSILLSALLAWIESNLDPAGIPFSNSAFSAVNVEDAIVEASAGSGGSNRFVNVQLSDMTTDLTTGTAKAAWFAPEDGNLVSVFTGLHDPSSSGSVTVDMNDSGGSVFTTLPSIDATEATSITGTAAVLDGTVSFVRGDKFTFDIDAAGTDAKGLQVCVEYTPT